MLAGYRCLFGRQSCDQVLSWDVILDEGTLIIAQNCINAARVFDDHRVRSDRKQQVHLYVDPLNGFLGKPSVFLSFHKGLF